MRRLLDKMVVIGVVLVASGAVAGAAAASVRTPSRHHVAFSPGSTWTQHTVCPAGMTVDLVATNVVTAAAPGGAQHVTGQVVATSSAGRSAHVALDYTVTSQSPGASVVTGTAVEIVAGGGAMVVHGTAYLAPDGFLGRYTGTATALCTTLAS